MIYFDKKLNNDIRPQLLTQLTKNVKIIKQCYDRVLMCLCQSGFCLWDSSYFYYYKNNMFDFKNL